MDKLCILYIDDQREVLATLSKDLQIFEKDFILEECESVAEACDVIADIEKSGDHVAVIISDHIMPDKNGIDFLVELTRSDSAPHCRKILLTGQATHHETIDAINNAHIDNYIEKPWETDRLVRMVKKQITHYILETGIEYQKYLPLLDQETLLQALSKQV